VLCRTGLTRSRGTGILAYMPQKTLIKSLNFQTCSVTTPHFTTVFAHLKVISVLLDLFSNYKHSTFTCPTGGLRGCRQDSGGQGSCSHHSGSDSAVGGPACSALCSHVRSVGRGGGKARRAGLLGGGRAVGRRGARLAGEQWALYAAKLTLARAGGGEDKKARSCRDSMTLC